MTRLRRSKYLLQGIKLRIDPVRGSTLRPQEWTVSMQKRERR